MAAAYLVSTGLIPDQASARIREVRPFIRLNPVQIAQFERFAAEKSKETGFFPKNPVSGAHP